ncbi:MAG TPA: DUF6582 domain-containing protein [Edaphobacter sp.]|uniref:DUF6582 domain-containing protein n=1 Tax=Edaphobacter sp. TaxID=1934404 RepID=UPI002C9233A7|nr:DUF6582 domain-containing protein [Edaphobacter sp.]HUZ96121.1 DUF6582 domain-containing protein [Edaphobacter sp.]
MKATWKPHTEHGKLSSEDRQELPESVYAFPKLRKEPMTDASHVRDAMARFDQVEGASDSDRDQAFANIHEAAKHYKIHMTEKRWQDFGKRPQTRHPAHTS